MFAQLLPTPMTRKHLISMLCYLLHSIFIQAQDTHVLVLEQQVYELNNQFKYDQSINLIREYLNKPNLSNEEYYYANLYLSYTHKRLFDYKNTLKYLDIALSYGKKTPRKDYFIANINYQKALALFDISQYKEADSIMQKISKNKYQYLDEEGQAKIMMQEAYLRYLNQDYDQANLIYDRAIDLLKVAKPCDLPMIYGKKIQLYGATKQDTALYNTYRTALRYADSCNVYKYTLYITEMMSIAFLKQGNYKNAYVYLCDFDSLKSIYDDKEHLDKIAELDAKYQISLKDYELEAKRKQLYYSSGVIVLLAIGLLALALLYFILQRQKNIISRQSAVNEHLIAILSHDIKEPLLGVQLLLKKLAIRDTFLLQASQSLERQIMAVNNVLSNLLQLKKMNASRSKKNEYSTNIATIIQQVLGELEYKWRSKNITIQMETGNENDLSMPIAPEKMQIILYNLLSNAIKYSFENGMIKIQLAHKSIIIRDFGTGIMHEYNHLLLKEVVGAKQGTKQEQGTGLGLYLVGQLIKGSPIKIDFESDASGTSTRISYD
jgi:signal transduction histidine kinase